jgi:hypothetical protein
MESSEALDTFFDFAPIELVGFLYSGFYWYSAPTGLDYFLLQPLPWESFRVASW